MSAEVHRIVVETTYLEVLDFDKTLGNTRALQRALEADAELHGIDSDKLRQTRRKTAGFDTVEYLRSQGVTTEELEDIKQKFHEAVQAIGVDNFFLPGAKGLLDIIDAQSRASLILTTGGGEWQRWKLAALGLHDRPFHVTSGRYKAELLARGFDPVLDAYVFDEVENLPDGAHGYQFTNFRMADDNIKAFKNMPRDAVGYLVAHDEETEKRNRQMPLSHQVVATHGLGRYIEALKQYN